MYISERFVLAPMVLETQDFSVQSITWNRVRVVTPGTFWTAAFVHQTFVLAVTVLELLELIVHLTVPHCAQAATPILSLKMVLALR